jgi:hypothetical protein
MNRLRHEFGDVGEGGFNALSLSGDNIFRRRIMMCEEKSRI